MLLLLYMVCAASTGHPVEVTLSSTCIVNNPPPICSLQMEMSCLLRTGKYSTMCMWVYMMSLTGSDQTQIILVVWNIVIKLSWKYSSHNVHIDINIIYTSYFVQFTNK